MDSFSIWHWIVVFFALVLFYFCGKVVKKAGFSPWLVLLLIVPIVNLVMLWVFAYAKWPAVPEKNA